MAAHQQSSSETEKFAVHPRFTEAVVFAVTGAVIGKAYDKVAHENVAIKAFFDLHLQYQRRVFALREIMYMTALHHDNIMALKNVIGRKKCNVLKCILLHMELMDDNLQHFVTSLPSAPQTNQIKQWMFQLMNGLHYMHTAGLVHRDLKPTNILIKQSTNVLKIADFDHTRKLGDEPPPDLTEVATSVEVRAPESLVRPSRYSYAIDVWALGCILYFLFTTTLLYNPPSQKSVLKKILSVFGKLTEEDVEDIEDPKRKKALLNRKSEETVNWKEMLPEEAPDSASDLLGKMLEFSAQRRIKLTEALYHEFLDSERAPGWVYPTYSGPEIMHYPSDMPYKTLQQLLQESVTLDLDDPELKNHHYD